MDNANTPAIDLQATLTRLERLESARERIEERLDEERHKLRALLVQRMARHKELFGHLLRDYDSTWRDICARREWLSGWRVEKGDLVASLSSSFRGETDTREMRFPMRYLGADGQEQMQADAAKLQAQHDEAKRRREEQALRAEREKLEELMRKHPDVVAAQAPKPPQAG